MGRTKLLEVLLMHVSGGIKMMDYENIVIAPRLNWLRRIVDDSYNSKETTLIEKDHLGDWSPEKDCCY